MNRQEFIRKLELELFKLPKEEVKDAIDYYNEYLDDAGIENEAAALKELGSPSRIATQIKADFAVKQLSNQGNGSNAEGRKGISAVWWVILGLFTAPVALPLAVAGGLLAFCILLTVALLVIAALLCVGAFFLSGIVAFSVGIYVLFIDFANGLFAVGVGLTFVGATVLLALGIILAAKGLVRFTARRMNEKRQLKTGRTEEKADE
ncbi:DUF1700 domain-containing protein [Aminipila butyrica]|uniref:DUF1700 domain-containing protein n=1 Tax=Aminipila butyrica TaxID=433296 RepID=A0A858BUL3_9FIRM|nr:DUF1700 domain-containing protein [Aminipila butyrica]QIB68778.1 DUF1700 domain-containing protein [Aminipila butyrica]